MAQEFDPDYEKHLIACEKSNSPKSAFQLVGEFHKKFNFSTSDNSGDLPSTDLLLFRLQFLQEELMELTQAIRKRDTVELADALADIIYVALGTAHYCKLPFDQVFDEVHRSNMNKERALSEKQSKRGHLQDVVKPVFWQPPDIAGVIERNKPEAVDD